MPETPTDPGCDICGKIPDPETDVPGEYLHILAPSEAGNVCSWICAAEYAVRKARQAASGLSTKIQELEDEVEGLRNPEEDITSEMIHEAGADPEKP